MDEKRLFTVQEANDLLPFLSSALEELQCVRTRLQEGADQAPSQQDITLHGGMPVDPGYLESVNRFQDLVGDICARGCQLKDLDSGLIDFPTVWEGREVYLCWKLGEPEVGHWHEIEAGFAGRRSLTTDPIR